VVFRTLTRDDIPALHHLEAESYLPALHESDEAFIRLMELFPDGAIGCFDDEGMCGYAFGVPLKAGSTLELRTPLAKIPDEADTFYIHDVAVADRCRGRGVGRALATRLLDLARDRGFTRLELVSVQGSASFWEKFGFRRVREFEYAPGARSTSMVCAWRSDPPASPE
jgi:ribosomal protein S18 acetylase RimI-like enzyme